MSGAPPDRGDLAALEAVVIDSLDRSDLSDLQVVGFGEISVALGWPSDEPTHVCKRMPIASAEVFDEYRGQVNDYISELRRRGVSVLDTDVMAVSSGSQRVPWLVQRLGDPDQLGDRVLAAAEPDAEHPLLVAVAEAIARCDERVSLDAQVTNWLFDGEKATLLDVGTPFMWHPDGSYMVDPGPLLGMFPAALRGFVRKELLTTVERWKQPTGVATDVVANLVRLGLDDWLEPAAAAFDRVLAPSTISIDEARSFWEEDLKTWPLLTRLQKAERAWRTRVRRQPYPYFIQSTVFEGGDTAIG